MFRRMFFESPSQEISTTFANHVSHVFKYIYTRNTYRIRAKRTAAELDKPWLALALPETAVATSGNKLPRNSSAFSPGVAGYPLPGDRFKLAVHICWLCASAVSRNDSVGILAAGFSRQIGVGSYISAEEQNQLNSIQQTAGRLNSHPMAHSLLWDFGEQTDEF